MHLPIALSFLSLLSTTTTTTTHALSTAAAAAAAPKTGTSYQNALQQKRSTVDYLSTLSPIAGDGDPIPEITRLRFALGTKTQAEAASALRETLTYRRGEGKDIIESAANAVEKATANGGWDNEPVRLAAPHADRINRFITPKNILTLSSHDGDLIYVIRASVIDDRELMDTVSIEEMTEFFLYVKEVHNLIANERTLRTGRLCEVIFANDISGVRKPPDKRFSQALSASSKQYEQLYPALAGPTLILNLPGILQAFVGLIKPLFPKTVQDRLKFKKAPVLARQKELSPLGVIGGEERERFLAEIQRLMR
jgi:hypothetical protein